MGLWLRRCGWAYAEKNEVKGESDYSPGAPGELPLLFQWTNGFSVL